MVDDMIIRRVGASYLVWEKERCEIQRAAFTLSGLLAETKLIAVVSTTRRIVVVGGLWGNAGANAYKFAAGTDSAVTTVLTGGLLELQAGVIRPLWAPWGLFKTEVGEALWITSVAYPSDFPGVMYYITPEG